jgi:FHA domain-containing protein
MLVDQGSATPVFVNDKPLGKGHECSLAEGDRVRIGAYEMKVGGVGRTTARSVARTEPIAPSRKSPQVPATARSGMSGTPSGANPFAELLGPSTPGADPMFPPTAAPKGNVQVPRDVVKANVPVGGGMPIPDDFDVFAENVPSRGGSGAGHSPELESLIDGMSDAVAGGIDELIGNHKDPGGDPFVGSRPDTRAGSFQADKSVDPLEIFGITPAAGAIPEAPQRNHAPETQSAFRPPQSFPDPAMFPPAPSPVPSARTSGTPQSQGAAQDALLAAFLDGSGLVNHEFLGPLTPEMMRLLGEMLREATQGTLDLLGARAATKREFRADMTMIQGQNNNPLKFSPNVEEALAHLLSHKSGAYMAPDRAMRDAYNDLRSHQIGFVAGVEAALAGVLARFNPAELEQRLSQKSVFDSLLPMARKAKLWDLLVELYGDIDKDAEDDFHSLFTKEFLRAYGKQVAELEKQQRLKGKS